VGGSGEVVNYCLTRNARFPSVHVHGATGPLEPGLDHVITASRHDRMLA